MSRKRETRDPDVLRARAEAEAGPPRNYVAVGWYPWGKNTCSLLSVGGKVVLFDTMQIAREFLPILGQGRMSHWSPDGETLVFTPVDPSSMNKVVLVRDYDPYNLPAQMPNGIRSETKSMQWRNHIMFSHAFLDCGQHVIKDGQVFNTLIDERHQTPGSVEPTAPQVVGA